MHVAKRTRRLSVQRGIANRMKIFEALGSSYAGPIIGNDNVSRQDLLPHVYTRGSWAACLISNTPRATLAARR